MENRKNHGRVERSFKINSCKEKMKILFPLTIISNGIVTRCAGRRPPDVSKAMSEISKLIKEPLCG